MPQRYIRLFPVLVALACIAGGARAATPFMTGGFMGLKLDTTPLPARDDTVAPFAGSLGFRLTPSLSLTGEYSGDADDGDRLGLVSLTYHIETGSSRFRPFLTIGAGLASSETYKGGPDGLGLRSETTYEPVWQAGGGLQFQITDDLALSGGYRHVGPAGQDNNPAATGGHELRMGVTWKMPVKRNIGKPLQ